MLQVYEEHHDLEYKLLNSAKPDQMLRRIIHENNIYDLPTTFNIRKVQDRLHGGELFRPLLQPPTYSSDVYIVSDLVYDDEEASETELHAIVAGAQLDEDDEPPRPPVRLTLPSKPLPPPAEKSSRKI